MLGFPRPKNDENHASSLRNLIVSIVVMAILFGFGLATLIFRLQTHASPDAVLPALTLSFAVLCGQFAMVRFLIRHITQTQE
jgi:hypothetical protein